MRPVPNNDSVSMLETLQERMSSSVIRNIHLELLQIAGSDGEQQNNCFQNVGLCQTNPSTMESFCEKLTMIVTYMCKAHDLCHSLGTALLQSEDKVIRVNKSPAYGLLHTHTCTVYQGTTNSLLLHASEQHCRYSGMRGYTVAPVVKHTEPVRTAAASKLLCL